MTLLMIIAGTSAMNYNLCNELKLIRQETWPVPDVRVVLGSDFSAGALLCRVIPNLDFLFVCKVWQSHLLQQWNRLRLCASRESRRLENTIF